jgi:5-methylthioadenosine/S-adenosylhomocysteine deaminase
MKEKVDILLAGGTVITVDQRRRIYRDGAVAMRGNEIVAVGKRADLAARYDAKHTRDCRNKLVMPGFVNSHLQRPAGAWKMADSLNALTRR